MKSVSFTGHRKVDFTYEIKTALINTLENLIKDGATDFYAGGAVGWDMLCSFIVIMLRKKHPHIRLHLVLPCSESEQTDKWDKIQKSCFSRIKSLADTIEYTSDIYFKGCMKKRNARLVKYADCCICYYNKSNKFFSGTGQTVRMAIEKGIEVINIIELI